MTSCRYRGQKMEELEMKTTPRISRILAMLTHEAAYNLALLMMTKSILLISKEIKVDASD